MRLLLDTHAVLWWVSNERSADRIQAAVVRSGIAPFVSAASVWEVAIKRAAGKLDAPPDLLGRLAGGGAELLDITAGHAEAVGELPLHHSDPFDRMLVAQAKLERCALLTRDRALAVYGVPIVW